MNTAVTIFQLLLVMLFTSGGLTKLFIPYDKFTNIPFQTWSKDFHPHHVKLIGIVETLAAIGMILSLILQSSTAFTTLVAVSMALVMAGAMATHLRRFEYFNMVGNFVWLGFALFVAYGTLIGFA